MARRRRAMIPNNKLNDYILTKMVEVTELDDAILRDIWFNPKNKCVKTAIMKYGHHKWIWGEIRGFEKGVVFTLAVGGAGYFAYKFLTKDKAEAESDDICRTTR